MKKTAFFTIMILWLVITFLFHSCTKEVHPQTALIEKMIGSWKTVSVKENGEDVRMKGHQTYKFVDQKVIVLKRFNENGSNTFDFQSKWAMSDDGSYWNHFIYGKHEIVSVGIDTMVLITRDEEEGIVKETTWVRF